MKGWAWFVVVQLVCFAAMVVGWFLLAPLAAGKFWKEGWSEHYEYVINVWRWKWIDRVWGNDEDGVTGALFYRERVPGTRWCTYLWTAWRNSSNNLRGVFARPQGPYYRWGGTSGWRGHVGFKPITGWPVLSANLSRVQ